MGYPYSPLQASTDGKPISVSVRTARAGQADRAPATVKLTVDSFHHAEASETRKQHQRPPDLDSWRRDDGASPGRQRPQRVNKACGRPDKGPGGTSCVPAGP